MESELERALRLLFLQRVREFVYADKLIAIMDAKPSNGKREDTIRIAGLPPIGYRKPFFRGPSA